MRGEVSGIGEKLLAQLSPLVTLLSVVRSPTTLGPAAWESLGNGWTSAVRASPEGAGERSSASSGRTPRFGAGCGRRTTYGCARRRCRLGRGGGRPGATPTAHLGGGRRTALFVGAAVCIAPARRPSRRSGLLGPLLSTVALIAVLQVAAAGHGIAARSWRRRVTRSRPRRGHCRRGAHRRRHRAARPW